MVCPKADAIYPIVSAASIVAKVHWPSLLHLLCIGWQVLFGISIQKCLLQVVRDNMLRDFKLAEVGLTREQHYGSGYPGGKHLLSDQFMCDLMCYFNTSVWEEVLQEMLSRYDNNVMP